MVFSHFHVLKEPINCLPLSLSGRPTSAVGLTQLQAALTDLPAFSLLHSHTDPRDGGGEGGGGGEKEREGGRVGGREGGETGFPRDTPRVRDNSCQGRCGVLRAGHV